MRKGNVNYMVRCKGTLKLVGKLDENNMEKSCERILNKFGYTELKGESQYYDYWDEMMYWELMAGGTDARCVQFNNCVYEIMERKEQPYDDKILFFQDETNILHYDFIYDESIASFREAIIEIGEREE